jgi:multiple sugar transport system ATP-binding protein
VAAIALKEVSKTYPNGHVAVRGVSLDIADGELLVLVGPSGSGKSTVLRLLAGLESVTAGAVFISGIDVTPLTPSVRDIAMVFQSYALYPHMSVRENLAFGLRMRGAGRQEIDERVAWAAQTLDIAPLLDRKPAQLSGGQRQRVALGRALVRKPNAFLLDEPLSNLDPLLRVATRTELALLHRRLAATMVYVTHDQEEAMTLGTRIAVMRDGRIEQVDSPAVLYQEPVNTFVAGFIGSPAINLLDGFCANHGASVRIPAGWSIDLSPPVPAADGTPLLIGVRPSDLEIVNTEEGDTRARVEVLEPLGPTAVVHLAVDGRSQLLRAVVAGDTTPSLDQAVGLCIRRGRTHIFDAATGRRLVSTLH